jgi:hypothetical protein
MMLQNNLAIFLARNLIDVPGKVGYLYLLHPSRTLMHLLQERHPIVDQHDVQGQRSPVPPPHDLTSVLVQGQPLPHTSYHLTAISCNNALVHLHTHALRMFLSRVSHRNGVPLLIHMTVKDKGRLSRHTWC